VSTRSQAQSSDPGVGVAPVSVHFVNNVLATAASYIEEDPERARDVLAELGAFLTHRLRGPRAVPLTEELEHVRVYVRLEQARFPERVVAELPRDAEFPRIKVVPGDLQAPVADVLDRWLTTHTGAVRLALRPRDDGADVQLDRPDLPSEAGERVHVELEPFAKETVA
jgi:LytS/YehU family sensor histidine kinase